MSFRDSSRNDEYTLEYISLESGSVSAGYINLGVIIINIESHKKGCKCRQKEEDWR